MNLGNGEIMRNIALCPHRLRATYSVRCHRVIIRTMTRTRMIRRWKLHGHIFRCDEIISVITKLVTLLSDLIQH